MGFFDSAGAFLRDNLINFISGLGTGKDPLTAARYNLVLMNRDEQEQAYRSGWLARKIVDAPAEDATREWRTWQASSEQIAALEELEKKFDIQEKMRLAILRGRLYGGAALVIGVDDGREAWEELNYDGVGKDGLKFVVVLNRYELNAGPRIYNVMSPWYTRPEYYTVATPIFGFAFERGETFPEGPTSSLTTAPQRPQGQAPQPKKPNGQEEGDRARQMFPGDNQGMVRIHPSRVVEFIGNELPDWRLAPMGGGWGDGVLQTVDEELKIFGTSLQGIGNMINDAKMDVVRIPDFSKNIATEEYRDRLLSRFRTANVAKSSVNTLLLDKEEEWERIQTQFGSLPEMMQIMMSIACGAGGIPLSRAMGASPGRGLSSKGSGAGEIDIRNYYDTVTSEQKTKYARALKPLDEVIKRSALGKPDPNIYYEWVPLYQPDPTELAAIGLQKAQTTVAYASSGLFNEKLIARAAANQIVEDGVYPGWEDAEDEFGLEPEAEEPPDFDPSTGQPHPAIAAAAKKLLSGPDGPRNTGGSPGGQPRPQPDVGATTKSPQVTVHIHGTDEAFTFDFNPNHSPETGRFISGKAAGNIKRARSTGIEAVASALAERAAPVSQRSAPPPRSAGPATALEAHTAGMNAVAAAVGAQHLGEREGGGLAAAAGWFMKREGGGLTIPNAETNKVAQRAYSLGKMMHSFFHRPETRAVVSKQVQVWATTKAPGLPSKVAAHVWKLTHKTVADAVSDHVLDFLQDTILGGVALAGGAIAGPVGAAVAVALTKSEVDQSVDALAEKVGFTPEHTSEMIHHVTSSVALHFHHLVGIRDAEVDNTQALFFALLNRIAELTAPGYTADFDPGEPRDPYGKWTTGGGSTGNHPFSPKTGAPKGIVFVSPSVDNLDFPGAVAALNSDRQRRLQEASGEIDRRLGLKSKDVPVVGAWSDGAENSVMTEYKGGDFAAQRLAAVMKGYLANQKAVLVFHEDPKGAEHLLSFEAKGELVDINKGLLEDGVANHTIVPHIGGGTVFVVDDTADHSTALAVKKGADRYGSEVYFQTGRGEFIGTQKQDGTDAEQRADARASYLRTIESSGVQGGSAVWQDIHNAYGEGLVKQLTPLKGSVGDPAIISSRLVTARGKTPAEVAALAAGQNTYQRADLDAARQDKAVLAFNVALFKEPRNYPQIRKGELSGDAEHDLGVIVGRMKANLKFLWNNTPAAERDEWKNWYEGAHKLVEKEAATYNLNHASVTGVFAALSPQKVWDANVYLARAVIKTYMTQQQHKWDDDMQSAASKIWKPKDQALVDLVRGKTGNTLAELKSPLEKAVWIRTFDEAHSDRTYNLVTPEGDEGPKAVNIAKNGVKMPSKAAWQTTTAVANAITSLEANGDREVISEAMGAKHKVRSFYNNILDPASPNGDVTIDTHAVGAALLSPYGGQSAQVVNALASSLAINHQKPGWRAAKSSAVTGVKGTYPIFAEAYRQTAKELGILPRQLQSVTWERKIELFGNSSPLKNKAIDAVWQDFHNSKIDLPTAQTKALEAAKAFATEGDSEEESGDE